MAEAQPPSGDSPGPGGLLRHSLTYSLAPLVKNGVSIGMTRFYTFVLAVPLLGVKELVDLWMLLLQHMLGQSLLMGMLRVYYDYKDERERAAVVTSTTIALSVAAWLVCGTMLLFSDSLWPLLIGQPTEGASALQISSAFHYLMLLVPFQLSTGAGFYYLQTVRRSALYTKLQTAKLFYEVGWHILLMGWFQMGLTGFLLGLLIGEITASLCLTGWMLVRLRPRFEWRVFRSVLSYGAPLVPVGVLQLGLHSLDRKLIEHVFSGAEGLFLTGIYGLGYKIGMLANAVCTGPFLQIWQPTIFSIEDPVERERLVGRVTTWLVVAIGAVTLAIVCGARQAVDLLAGQASLAPARVVVPWIAIGYVFWALYNSAQIPLLLAKRTMPLVGINALALAFSVGLNLYLIPHLDILGASLATLATFAFLSGAVMLVVRRMSNVHFELGRLGGTFAILLATGGAVRWLDEFEVYAGVGSFLLVMGAKTLVLVLALAGLWFGVLHAFERAGVLGRVREKLGR